MRGERHVHGLFPQRDHAKGNRTTMNRVSRGSNCYHQFRGWLDDLLKTSWEACQGTDVLVESPSAMGGFHIAEALRIPYFRAFTMTWSRTRAYPHAFAVPEHKVSPLPFVYDILLTVSIQDGRELQLHGTIAFIL